MDTAPNYIDIALMAILAFFVVRALIRGFIRELIGLVGVVAAVVVSAMTYVSLGNLLQSTTGISGEWWPAAAFVLVLISVFVLFSYLGSMLSKLVHKGAFSLMDRLFGAATGLVKGILICYLLINLALLFTPFQVPDLLKESVVSPYLVKAGRYLVDLVPQDLTRDLQEKAGFLSPGKNKSNSPQNNSRQGSSLNNSPSQSQSQPAPPLPAAADRAIALTTSPAIPFPTGTFLAATPNPELRNT